MKLASASLIPTAPDQHLPGPIQRGSYFEPHVSAISARQSKIASAHHCSGPVDCKSLFALADRRTQPLLYQALSQFQTEISAEQRRHLQPSHQLNLRKALLLSRELIRILEHLSALKIEALPTKASPLRKLCTATSLSAAPHLVLSSRPHPAPAKFELATDSVASERAGNREDLRRDHARGAAIAGGYHPSSHVTSQTCRRRFRNAYPGRRDPNSHHQRESLRR